MAEENVEIVRRVYEGWARGDFSSVEHFDPEIDFEMVPAEIVDYGSKVLVLNRIEASGKESGAGVGADTATVWTLKDGKAVRMALYWDVDAARRAAATQD